MRFIQVTFAGNTEVLYDFKTKLDVVRDDLVVCHTARGCSIGRVHGFLSNSKKATNWAFQRVDMAALDRLRLDEEREQKELDDLLG
ncbi:MAG: hypothetical protein K0R22_40 [Sporomusa sp.]|jgi:hypothetical protein|nr:hypothetical protein [Sporomusa sp.]